MAATPTYKIDLSWLSLKREDFFNFLDRNDHYLNSGRLFNANQNVTFSFFTAASQVGNSYDQQRIPTGATFKFIEFKEADKAHFRAMTNWLENFINLDFKEVAGGSGLINIGITNTTVGGYAYYPNGERSLWIDDSSLSANATQFSSSWYEVLWHEFGHSLGLSHPRNYNWGVSTSTSGLSNSLDVNLLTIESYKESFAEAYFFSPLDLFALLSMYGVSKNSKPLTYNIDLKNYLGSSLNAYQFNDDVLGVSPSETNPVWIFGTSGFDVLNIRTDFTIPRLPGSVYQDVYCDARYGYLTSDVKLLSNNKLDVSKLTSNSKSFNLYNMDGITSTTFTADVSDAQNYRGSVYVMPYDNKKIFGIELCNLDAGNDYILVGDFFNKIFSAAGNDIFTGYASNVSLDGGVGIDTLLIDGVSNQYALNPSKITMSKDIAAKINGMDIKSIERVKFNDVNLALDIGSTQNAGSVYMLYKAAFNRPSDAGGMGYWLAQKDAGKDIVSNLAQGFVTSPEFIALYGANPSNATYVNKLYQNVLGRAGEAEGVAYWNTEMNAGRVSKAQALVSFAASPEGAQLVAPLIANGIQYQEWVG